MPKKYTGRGFRIYSEFIDTYGSKAKVQMSSAVVKRCWVFVKEKDDDEALKKLRERPELWRNGDAALHLDQKQAKRLIKALEAFCADE